MENAMNEVIQSLIPRRNRYLTRAGSGFGTAGGFRRRILTSAAG